MARIRTIKPEFFTSEDIVSLSAFARLLYIAIWCEADREGRLVWKPKTFKIRYFPADTLDIDQLCEEILSIGLVKKYGDGLAYIPAFLDHQHLNPRETPSKLPEPRDSDASTTREPRDSDAQGGREGKGRERKTRVTRLPDDLEVSELQKQFCKSNELDLDDEFERFKLNAVSKALTYADWSAAFGTWIRNAVKWRNERGGKQPKVDDPFAGVQ